MKKSFTIYNDSLDSLDELSDEQAGKLLRAIKDFNRGENVIISDVMVRVAFAPFRAQFIRDGCGKSALEISEINTKNRKLRKSRKGNESNESNESNEFVYKSNSLCVSDSNSNSDSNSKGGVGELKHPLQIFAADLSTVSKLKTQLTEENCFDLEKEFGIELVKEVLEAMENTKTLTQKYTSVYLTCRNWLKLRNDKSKTNGKQLEDPAEEAKRILRERRGEN